MRGNYKVPFDSLDSLHKLVYGGFDDIRKDAPIYSGLGVGVWQAIYGKKVWSQLNYEANLFGLQKKEPWTQSGVRIETAFPGDWTTSTAPTGGTSEGTTSITAIPATIKPTFDSIQVKPKIIWHGFDVTELAEFLATVDDGIDVLPVMREEIGKFHALQINAMLHHDADTITNQAVDVESADRMICNAAEVANCSLGAEDGNAYSGISANQVDRSSDRTETWSDAQVSENSGVDRTLTLAIIDDLMEDVWSAGGNPKVVVTGYDILMAWQQLLQAQRRFMDSGKVVASFNGVQSVAPGVEGGFLVSTYYGVPIIPSQLTKKDTKSRIYFFDTDYTGLRVARPTQYFESKDMLALDKLGMEGGYRTMAELICTFYAAQGKIRDLK
jgi:hypothetical protein